MMDIENLGAIRASRTGDNKSWSVSDVLASTLSKIETGELKVNKCCLILVREDGKVTRLVSNIKAFELLGLLSFEVVDTSLEMRE